MASFSSLPQELVDFIVQLATPSFGLNSYKERAMILKRLCLVNRTLFHPARQLLLSRVVVNGPSSLFRLISRLETASSTDPVAVQSMIIDRGCERGVSWSAASVYGQHDSAEQDTDEEDVEKVSVVKAKKAILLVERLRPKEVAIISVSNPLMSHLRYTGTLLLFNCDPSLDTVSFQHLTRLGLYSLDIVGQKPFLSPVHFPNLVTLAVKGTITMSRARSYDNNLGPLRWSIDHIPVLPQLKAVSEWYNDGDSPLAVTVLDTWCAGEAVQYPERISSTVQVLRLTHGGMSEPSEYTPLLRLLTSPSFTANLVELHLLYFDRDPGQGLSATKAWCEAHNVKLYTSNPDDLMDPFDFSFWRFLDGVKDRLGLKSNLDISRRGSGQGTA